MKLVVAAIVLTGCASPTAYDRVLTDFKQTYGVQARPIPFVHLFSGADIAMTNEVQVEAWQLFTRVRNTLGPQWQQIVRAKSPHESTAIFAAVHPAAWGLMIVSVEATQVTLLQTSLEMTEVQRWLNSKPAVQLDEPSENR